MPTDDPNDLDRVDREIRINEMKRRTEELVGGTMREGESSNTPPVVKEGFWRCVVAYESAPWTTHFKQLTEASMALPAPDEMDDRALTAKLWELIDRLAGIRVFLSQTDHLNDRELYTLLWSDVLREEIKDFPPEAEVNHHIDLLSSGSEEDTRMYLKYYADDAWREDWATHFPEDKIPDHEDPPYDRDRQLPRCGSASRPTVKSDPATGERRRYLSRSQSGRTPPRTLTRARPPCPTPPTAPPRTPASGNRRRRRRNASHPRRPI